MWATLLVRWTKSRTHVTTWVPYRVETELGRLLMQGPTCRLQSSALSRPVDRYGEGRVSTLNLATTIPIFVPVQVLTSVLNLLNEGRRTLTRFRTFIVLTCRLCLPSRCTSRYMVPCPLGQHTPQLPQQSLVLGLVLRVHRKVRGTNLLFKTLQNPSPWHDLLLTTVLPIMLYFPMCFPQWFMMASTRVPTCRCSSLGSTPPFRLLA